jgi:hypothetical protein
MITARVSPYRFPFEDRHERVQIIIDLSRSEHEQLLDDLQDALSVYRDSDTKDGAVTRLSDFIHAIRAIREKP